MKVQNAAILLVDSNRLLANLTIMEKNGNYLTSCQKAKKWQFSGNFLTSCQHANWPNNDNFWQPFDFLSRSQKIDNFLPIIKNCSQSYQNWQIIYSILIGVELVTILPKVSSETKKVAN